MFWRVFVQCWFALLVVVLPSQVMAHALQNDHTAASFDSVTPQTLAIDYDKLFESVPQPAIPSSQSHDIHSSYAILNHSRNVTNSRVMAGCGSDVPFDFNSDEPKLGSVSRPQLVRVSYSNRNYDFFTSTHRLAGWKESNAMYVALNSQYQVSTFKI
ncbi:hypothetical protein V9K26_002495 [Vibrio cholerae]|nr:hypothetical protein [Vibrio cholerae]EJB8581967.1 hypothetical protein [Vibrio cholerae]EKA3899164.1 hypothetical protein [Vibrio cholerae]EKF9088932.1 hypothetical protein [Vibrio cholerae]HDL8943671.1 hypothetical protein [Vibrio cholerae]